uniref:Uncharacterized protein n=1 Tax=Arundo donax TaxID=35708 RepID=A0A0A9DQY0_ARUDO
MVLNETVDRNKVIHNGHHNFNLLDAISNWNKFDAPQSRPSIFTLLTASSSFCMSVSSSHGLTSIRTDDFPAKTR